MNPDMHIIILTVYMLCLAIANNIRSTLLNGKTQNEIKNTKNDKLIMKPNIKGSKSIKALNSYIQSVHFGSKQLY